MNASLLGTIDFTHWWVGYKGLPYGLNVVGIAGLGWGHTFGQLPEDKARTVKMDRNALTSKVGVDLMLNIGNEKTWQIYFEPALTYHLNDGTQYNINRSVFGLSAGLIYKFKNSDERKDPSKVDRSASYAMRWVAKNVVAAGLAQRCEIQVAYAIGSARPVGLHIETFATHTVPVERIRAAIEEVFDLRPAAMIAQLDLLRPIYRATSAYGHFGRPGFSWEATDRVRALRDAV